ncbi:metallophosphoesterase [Candidatus Woesearchaeota archaeon]|nr:metallophosphoesterase [Candidatus Woesearchaeota archaeon]
MKMIGIISDTHDNVVNVKKAVEKFKEADVGFVVHVGDIIAPKTVTFFEGVKLKAVKGNCDGDIKLIKKKLEEIGGEYLGELGEIEYKGKKFGIYHGTDPARVEGMINSGKYDYVLTGHTHIQRDEKIGKTRVINPGAHYYGAENTIVLLDVEKDIAKVVELK